MLAVVGVGPRWNGLVAWASATGTTDVTVPVIAAVDSARAAKARLTKEVDVRKTNPPLCFFL